MVIVLYSVPLLVTFGVTFKKFGRYCHDVIRHQDNGCLHNLPKSTRNHIWKSTFSFTVDYAIIGICAILLLFMVDRGLEHMYECLREYCSGILFTEASRNYSFRRVFNLYTSDSPCSNTHG